MGARGKRKKVPPTAPPVSRVQSSDDIGELLADIVYSAVEHYSGGNLRGFLIRIGLGTKSYQQVYYILSRYRRTGQAKPLPRIANTSQESKLYRNVRDVWKSRVEMRDVFPKFTSFYQDIAQCYRQKKPTKLAVKMS
jgi:hypothetical protein